jgi:hypothetical protein
VDGRDKPGHDEFITSAKTAIHRHDAAGHVARGEDSALIDTEIDQLKEIDGFEPDFAS